MTGRRNRRKRWPLTPRVIEFEPIRLDVSLEDIMADLDPGWNVSAPRPHAARPARGKAA